MKKMIIVLTIAVLSSSSNASQDSRITQKEQREEHQKNGLVNVDCPVDEYGYSENNNIDEYDQHVCDDAQAPKISAAQAVLTNIMAKLLIQYLTVKEMAHIYFQEIKDVPNGWFNRIVKL